ncbi:winged helix/forkhead transcription factor [Lithospermum erythrorhizon]|uniref:Winged helix/forkhead transcription factor n=1 Tax=Lithospermum erythrorhizon TaxID=34254 RepID=A0AAV3RBH1_LITER
MREQEGCPMSNNGSSNKTSNIHILLVDHEKELLISTARMLELCSYKVTMVEFASTALLMLSKGNENFDLVMANIQSPDMYGYQLLKEADRLCLPVILLSSESNPDMAKVGIESGAILFLQRPTTLEVLMYLWQLVLSDKRRRITQLSMNGNERGKKRNLKEANIICNEDEVEQIQIKPTNNKLKKKECTQWTKELHAKFLEAVNQLGEGRCYPKEIWQLMNVPGLTRMQVASHLQKCRNYNWKIPKEHRTKTINGRNKTSNISHPHHRSKNNLEIKRFGIQPQLPTIEKNQEPLETQALTPNDKEEVSNWQNNYHLQSPLEVTTDQWLNGNNIPGGYTEANDGEVDLVNQYTMPNISTSGSNYLSPDGSLLAAPPEHGLHGTYENFGSEVDCAMQNYNLQGQIPSARQWFNLNDQEFDQPLY